MTRVNLSNLSKRNALIAIAMVLSIAIAFGGSYYARYKSIQSEVIAAKLAEAEKLQNLPEYTSSELEGFNGTNPDKPIYIGLEGYVYDVTEGSRFYAQGNSYNYLAGRDSTVDLQIAGGDIIKVKYPIVGRLVTE